MNDERLITYCRRMIVENLEKQNQDFTNEIAKVLGSDVALLDHCYGIRDLMNRCIEILQSRGVDLDDEC